jgi:hypothetical protein
MDQIHDFPNLPPSVQEEILNSPGMAPPDHVTPNLENPPNDNTQAIVVSVVCLTLVVLSSLIRAYARVVILKVVKLEDCTFQTASWQPLVTLRSDCSLYDLE